MKFALEEEIAATMVTVPSAQKLEARFADIMKGATDLIQNVKMFDEQTPLEIIHSASSTFQKHCFALETLDSETKMAVDRCEAVAKMKVYYSLFVFVMELNSSPPSADAGCRSSLSPWMSRLELFMRRIMRGSH